MSSGQSQKGRVKVGDVAPDFTLPSQTGAMVSLKHFRGKKAVVLYFCPRDYSRGCTAEACTFQDSYEIFKDVGAEVIGASSQSVESHSRFAADYRLPFVLLSDEGGLVRKVYGVPSTFGLIPGRVAYVIDRQGAVRHVFNSQFDSKRHIEEALRVLKEISQGGGT